MKISLLLIGKTSESYLQQGMDEYFKRLKHYISFNIEVIPALKKSKNLSQQEIKQKEGQLILNKLSNSDTLILLDERGREMNSIAFADDIRKSMLSSVRNLVFVVGGAYGFSEEVYSRSNRKISLSKMTFSHQLVRLVFLEQLYRAFTIIKNEPYHHE